MACACDRTPNIESTVHNLCLGAPSLNNAVYVNSISQAMITRSGRSFFFGELPKPLPFV